MPHRALEPAYTIDRRLGDIEIRDYSACVVAEVFIGASADEAISLAFPVLAAYIFGKNHGAKSFGLSAPMALTTAPVHFTMRAPLTQIPRNGGYMVQFALPRDVTLSAAPEPEDPRVQLRDVPAQRVAAIRYIGHWSESIYGQHLATLTAALCAARLAWAGEPVFTRYNAPWTPWFLRRSEIWVSLG